jgi:serine/threonine protein kinase
MVLQCRLTKIVLNALPSMYTTTYASFSGASAGLLCTLQMILQLAVRLKELHALGYVHRDLKPGNVMWLPRENRWTVIDFGCVARIGESARLGFSVKYAAPEVITAYRRGANTMIVQVCHWAVQVSFVLLGVQGMLSKLIDSRVVSGEQH